MPRSPQQPCCLFFLILPGWILESRNGFCFTLLHIGSLRSYIPSTFFEHLSKWNNLLHLFNKEWYELYRLPRARFKVSPEDPFTLMAHRRNPIMKPWFSCWDLIMRNLFQNQLDTQKKQFHSLPFDSHQLYWMSEMEMSIWTISSLHIFYIWDTANWTGSNTCCDYNLQQQWNTKEF